MMNENRMLEQKLDNQSYALNEMYNMIQDKLNALLMLMSKQTEALERIASAMEKPSCNTNKDAFK